MASGTSEPPGESAAPEAADQEIVGKLQTLVRQLRTSGTYKETGERLFTIERPADHGRPAESVHFNWSQYHGHAYFSVRVWRETQKGPVPDATKGISIRLDELEEWVKALEKMVEKFEAERGRKNKGRAS